MIKLAICDDEELFRKQLLNILEEYFKEYNIKYKCDVFNNGVELLKTCELEGYDYNFIFLDVIMDEINGIEVGRRVKEINPNSEIIFVSISPDFVFESFDLNPFNYLLKPLKEGKVREQIKRVINKLGLLNNSKKYITLKKNGAIILIYPNDILYVDANNRMITIHCTYDKVSFYGKIDDILTKINTVSNFNFLKCHRSYIVNPYYIKRIDKSKIILNNDDMIPVSRLKYEGVKRGILDYHSQLKLDYEE